MTLRACTDDNIEESSELKFIALVLVLNKYTKLKTSNHF